MNDIIIAPISGGKLVTQLTILELLCSLNYKPKYALGASGGNASIFLAMAADWRWTGIRRISQYLNSSMLLLSWSSIKLLSYIIGFFKGSFHSDSYKLTEFYKNHFDEDSIQNLEIWTLCYNNDHKLSRLFCNKGVSDIYKENNLNIKNCMSPIYANGNIDLISKYCYATASIPSLIPPQIINGESYSDGGIGAASPLTFMSTSLKKLDSCRMIYLSSIDINSEIKSFPKNLVDTWIYTTDSIINTILSYDRNEAYKIIEEKGKVKYFEFDFKLDIVNKILKSNIKYFLLEIFPNEIVSLDVLKFTGYDVAEKMSYIRNNKILKCRFWYV